MNNDNEFIWSDVFSIGNKAVDRDHQRLLEIYNELGGFLKMDYDRSKFAETLSKMSDYSIYHFNREELYMQKLSYPDFESHKKQHKEFIIEVSTYNSNFLTANPPDPSVVVSFLENWWINHILQIDRKYEKFREENGLNIEY